jgi:hypothetical protein
LNSFRVSCKRKRREIEYLYNEKARIEAIVRGFNSSNDEYFKTKNPAEENVLKVF